MARYQYYRDQLNGIVVQDEAEQVLGKFIVRGKR